MQTRVVVVAVTKKKNAFQMTATGEKVSTVRFTRFAFLGDKFLHDCEPEVMECFRRVIGELQALGLEAASVDPEWWTNSIDIFAPLQASEAALVHAARILAKECRGPADIRVNVISPGVNDAGMAKASIASGKYAQYLESGAIPRYGRAADIAGTGQI